MQDSQTLSTAPLITGQEAARLYPLGAQLAERVIVLPGERIHMSGVEIPIRDARKRMSALPFAMEPELAQPLSDLYFAIGPRLSTNRYVAAAIDRSVIKSWIERAGDGDTILTPEMALLPVPEPGKLSHLRIGDRNIIRTPDGGGFVATNAQLHVLWNRLSRPVLVCFGKPPDGLDAVPEVADFEVARISDAASIFDLRAEGARSRTGDRTQLKVAAALIVGVMAAHTLIAGADAVALRQVVSEREQDLAAEFRERFPSLGADTRPQVAIDRIVAASGADDALFLQLLSGVSAAVPATASISVNDMRFDEQTSQLLLRAESGDMQTLEGVASAIRNAGFSVELGSTRMIDGGAEGDLIVTDGEL